MTNKFEIKDFEDKLAEAYDKEVVVQQLQNENKELKAKQDNVFLKKREEESNKVKELEVKILEEDITARRCIRSRMQQDIEDRKKSIKFLFDGTSRSIIIAPHSLVTICALTNQGKSTFAAAIAEALVSDDKKILILSNEEIAEDFRARVSCIRTGVSFGSYKNNKCTQEQCDLVMDDSELISDRLIVIGNDNDADAYRTGFVEGVIRTIKSVVGKVDLVILDYFQNVSNTSVKPGADAWFANNRLADELNVLKNQVDFPIIVFAQCKGLHDKDSKDKKKEKDMNDNHPMWRFIGGTQILRTSSDIIELCKDYTNSRSLLFVHKRRFQDMEWEQKLLIGFDKKQQKFVPYSKAFASTIEHSKVLSKIFDDEE